MGSERGFTLIEIVVGAAIAAALTWTIVALADRTIAAAQAFDSRLTGSAGVSHAIERMTSESASALAVYVPTVDVLGNANSDGHEVDFYAQDASHRPYGWSYTYDATAKTLTRYAIVPGSTPIAGETVATIDGFSASLETADSISNPASAAYDPLFAGVHASDIAYQFPDKPSAVGGNRLVALQFTASGVNERIVLASADAPTAFTVVVTYTPSPIPVATPTPVPPTLTP
jgi:prepilin-type N-terminal cleavage/methylation domain-containing protein